jgi:hypothetical protein
VSEEEKAKQRRKRLDAEMLWAMQNGAGAGAALKAITRFVDEGKRQRKGVQR